MKHQLNYFCIVVIKMKKKNETKLFYKVVSIETFF